MRPSRFAAAVIALSTPWIASCTSAGSDEPACNRPDSPIFVLEAQSVPSATRVPCITSLPVGWRFAGSLVESGSSRLWLDHDRAGIHAVEVQLSEGCDVGSAVEVPPAPSEAGMRIYELPTSLSPRLTGERFLRFEGGCITYRFSFTAGADPTLVIEAEQALSTIPRAQIVRLVEEDLDLPLCGTGAPPCAGAT
jgi:hypothetical protein